MAEVPAPAWEGDGTLWNSPLLVLARVSTSRVEYDAYDHHGRLLAEMRPATALSSTLDISHPGGALIAKLEPKRLVDARGPEIGTLPRRMSFRKKGVVTLESHGTVHGTIDRVGRLSFDFLIVDPDGEEVGRSWHNADHIAAAYQLPTAGRSVHLGIALHRPLPYPFSILAVAGILSAEENVLEGSD